MPPDPDGFPRLGELLDSVLDSFLGPDGSRGMYYDRAGNEISLGRWIDLFEDWNYRCIGRTLVGEVIVSTVWLGLNHALPWGPPLVFETMMTVPAASGEALSTFEDYQERYSTEREARAGHEHLVKELQRAQHELERMGQEIVPFLNEKGP